jgi:hypothetical protein
MSFGAALSGMGETNEAVAAGIFVEHVECRRGHGIGARRRRAQKRRFAAGQEIRLALQRPFCRSGAKSWN